MNSSPNNISSGERSASCDIASSVFADESSAVPAVALTLAGIGLGSLIFIGVLVLAIVILAPLTAISGVNGPSFISTSCVGCQLALAAIIAIWFSVANLSRSLRIGVSLLLLAINGFVLLLLSGGPDLILGLLPFGVAFPVVFVLELIKSRFGSFTTLDSNRKSFQEGLQFQISHLFIATTVVAVLMGLGQLFQPWVEHWIRNYGGGNLFVVSVVSVVPAISTLISVWASMGQKIAWRIPVAIFISITVMIGGILVLPHFQTFPMLWFGIVGIPWLGSLALLLLLRRDGFRFVRTQTRDS